MPRRKADYPEWVMEHKKKGTYINKIGDKYYLYAAHSERVPGTNKIRRVCDGYLGRITEKDGLIPPKDKLRDSKINSLEFGLSYIVALSTENIHTGLRRNFVKYGDLVYVSSILAYIFGTCSHSLFENSWLSLRFPELVFPESFTDAQLAGIDRGTRMITDTMYRRFGNDLADIRTFSSLVSLIRVDGRLYCPLLPQELQILSDKYSIDWRNPLWQK